MADEHGRKLLEGLAKPFPPEVIESRPGGGGKSFQYIKGWAVVERLNEVAGEWSTEVKWREIRPMDLFEYNKSIQKNEVVTRDVMMVEIDLTVPGLGTRTGLGVQIMRPGSEDIVKGAWTDALKVAASKFMVAHDLYKAGSGDTVQQQQSGGSGGGSWQGDGGGSDPVTEKQWGMFHRLVNKHRIDKDQIVSKTVGKRLDQLDKRTISTVIKRLVAIDEGQEEWNPGGNIQQAAPMESGPVVDHDGVIQDDGEGMDESIQNWTKTIQKATTGSQLDKIYESLSEYGLAGDQRLIDALEARNQEISE